jgi:hypothetical protein
MVGVRSPPIVAQRATSPSRRRVVTAGDRVDTPSPPPSRACRRPAAFDTDNLISNEASYLHRRPARARSASPGAPTSASAPTRTIRTSRSSVRALYLSTSTRQPAPAPDVQGASPVRRVASSSSVSGWGARFPPIRGHGGHAPSMTSSATSMGPGATRPGPASCNRCSCATPSPPASRCRPPIAPRSSALRPRSRARGSISASRRLAERRARTIPRCATSCGRAIPTASRCHISRARTTGAS